MKRVLLLLMTVAFLGCSTNEPMDEKIQEQTKAHNCLEIGQNDCFFYGIPELTQKSGPVFNANQVCHGLTPNLTDWIVFCFDGIEDNMVYGVRKGNTIYYYWAFLVPE